MRAYECIYILDPSLEEAAIKEKTERFNEVVKSRSGSVTKIDNWGKRKLAYPIEKRFEGNYIFMKFTGNNEILAELNRLFSFDDVVLRHLIVLDEKPASPEAEEAPAAEEME
jgi:small subunit ribosomal protein S6